MHIKIYNYMVFVVMVLCAFLITISSNLIIEQIEINAQWSAHTVSPGDPDSDGFYKVYTPGHLAWCAANNVSKVKIMASLNLSEYQWVPFGTSTSSPWSGTFEGNGYEISGLTITKSDYSYAVAGLFGAVKSSTIRNVILSNININLTKSATDVGGLIAYPQANSSSNIVNCSVLGSIKFKSNDLTYTNQGIGGIIGYNRADLTIRGCHNYATVSNYINMKTNFYTGAGGILGTNVAGFVDIIGCSNYGDILNVENDDNSYSHSAGGIFGICLDDKSDDFDSAVDINSCGNIGKITSGDDESDGHMEQVDGDSDEWIQNYYVTNAYAGGISGYGGNITNCFNRGYIYSNAMQQEDYKKLEKQQKTISSADSHYNFGGYSITFYEGAWKCVLDTNYSATTIDRTNSSYYTSTTTLAYTGGICGFATDNNSISNCYNIGSIGTAGKQSYSVSYPIAVLSTNTIHYDDNKIPNDTSYKYMLSGVNTCTATFSFDKETYYGNICGSTNQPSNCYSNYKHSSQSIRVTFTSTKMSVYDKLSSGGRIDYTKYHNSTHSYLTFSYNNNVEHDLGKYYTTYKYSNNSKTYYSYDVKPMVSTKYKISYSNNTLKVICYGIADLESSGDLPFNYELLSYTINDNHPYTYISTYNLMNTLIDSEYWKIDPKLNDGYPVPKGLYY